MIKVVGLVGLLCVAQQSLAEPVVIADYGGRASGVPNKSMLSSLEKPIQRPPVGILKNYPVRSSLRPGYLNEAIPLETPQPKAKPFFIVSNDEFSRDWIDKNKEYLLEIHAQGLATNINNEAELNDLKQWAAPLAVMAIPVDEIAEVLNIQVYPVLVTGKEIAQ